MTIAVERSNFLHINHVRQYPANIFVRNTNLENEIDKGILLCREHSPTILSCKEHWVLLSYL